MPQVPKLNRFYPVIPLKELTSFYSVGNQAFPTTPASGNTPALTHRVAILSYLPKTLFIFDEFQYSNHYVLLLENLTQVTSITWEFQLYLNGMKKNNGSFLKAVDTNPFEYILYFQGSITENNGQPKFDRLDITCTVVNGSETLTLKLTHNFAKATGVTQLVSGSQTLPFAGDPLTYNFVANQLKEYLPNEQKVPPSLEVLKWNNQAIEIVDTENEALLFTLLGVLYYNIQTSKAMNGELTRSFEWKDFSQPALIESIETGTPYKGNFKIGIGMLPLHILSDAMPVNVNAIPDFANIASTHPLFAILSASGSIVYDEVAVETQHIVPPLLQQSKDRLLANQARLITLYHYAQFPKSAIRMVAVLIKFLFECSQKNNCNECKKRTLAFTTATLTKLKEIPNLAKNILTHYYREPYNKIKKFAPQAVKVADLIRSPYTYSLVHNVAPRIVKAYFAKRTVHKVSDDYYELDFERVDSEMFTDASRTLKDVNGVSRVDALGNSLRKPDWDNFLGRETYLVVETWGCKGRTVRCSLSVTPDVFTAGTNSGNLIVQVNNAFSSDIDKALNQYDSLLTNANVLPGNNLALVTEYLEVNHSNKAIIRLRIRPDTVPAYDNWTTSLGINRISLSITAKLTSNEACFFGNEIRQTAPNGRFLHATDKYNNSCQYRLENRIVYEVHHANDLWSELTNPIRTGKIHNNFIQNIQNNTAHSPSKKVAYFYLDNLGHEHFVCETLMHLARPKRRVNYSNAIVRGNPLNPPQVSYAANRTAGEQIDAITLFFYENGTYVEGNSNYNTNNENAAQRKWYENTSPNFSVELILADIVENPYIGPNDVEGLLYVSPSLRIAFNFDNTRRRYSNPNLFAGLIGALAQQYYRNSALRIITQGFAYQDGSCYPSAEHVDGNAMDSNYLANQASNQSFINDLDDYGFRRFRVGFGMNYNAANGTVTPDGPPTPPATTTLHTGHLHSTNFDSSPANIEEIIR